VRDLAILGDGLILSSAPSSHKPYVRIKPAWERNDVHDY